MSTSVTSFCPVCKKELPAEGLSFCPYCAAPLSPLPDGKDSGTDKRLQEYLIKADGITDLRKRKDVLLEARAAFPDELMIERELLMIGTPRPRKRAVDFFIIKCYLLQMYLTPDEFPEEMKAELRDELFQGEQLQKCMSLAPDADAFFSDYLLRLSADFIRIFLKDSTVYNRSIFGFRLERKPERGLAAPVAKMILSVREDGVLTAQQKTILERSLYQGFRRELGGKTLYLDELLS